MALDDNGGHELTPARSTEEHRVGDAGTAVVIRDAVENRGEKPPLFSMFIFQCV